jgi:polyisoprenoid-binding protein YceI
MVMEMFHMKPWMYSVGLALGALAGTASAQQTLLPAQSELGFVMRQMGVPVEGRFRQFDAQVAFDPAQPARSKVSFKVDIASITMGSREVDVELPKPVWFNTARFPQALFESSAIKGLGGGKFEVAGRLTVKGLATNVVVPVALTQPTGPGGVTFATGTFPIKRLTFKIGENEWSDTSMVADDVQVRFKLALQGVGKL